MLTGEARQRPALAGRNQFLDSRGVDGRLVSPHYEVRTADGEPLKKGTCSIKWLVTHPLDAELDELGTYFEVRDGRLELRLQPGRHSVRVWDEDHEERRETEIAISEGAVVEQRVDLRPD